MNEQEKRYCPTCGKRIEKPAHTYILESENGPVVVNYYVTNHTEPICSGYCVLQSYVDSYPTWAARTEVPSVFQDAFSEDIEL